MPKNCLMSYKSIRVYYSGIDFLCIDSLEIDEFHTRIESDLALSSKVHGIYGDLHWFVNINEKFRMDLTPDLRESIKKSEQLIKPDGSTC